MFFISVLLFSRPYKQEILLTLYIYYIPYFSLNNKEKYYEPCKRIRCALATSYTLILSY
jgi:hypothetical protein